MLSAHGEHRFLDACDIVVVVVVVVVECGSAGPFVEYLGAVPAPERAELLERLQAQVDALIAADIPTVVKSGTRSSPIMNELGVRPAFLEPYADDQVRALCAIRCARGCLNVLCVDGSILLTGGLLFVVLFVSLFAQELRVVAVGGAGCACPCGGTHVTSTGQIGRLVLKKVGACGRCLLCWS